VPPLSFYLKSVTPTNKIIRVPFTLPLNDMGILEYRSVYKITLENGHSWTTSMAKGITLDQARKYFMGQLIEMPDEKSSSIVASVEICN
jgi:hypothetical protein